MPCKTFIFIGGEDCHSGVTDAAYSGNPRLRISECEGKNRKFCNWVQKVADWGWARI